VTNSDKAFLSLPSETRRSIMERLEFRRARFKSPWSNMAPNVLLIGDRPANGAEEDPEFQNVPFAARWNSSLWLNKLLHEANIPEVELSWVNSWQDGRDSDRMVLLRDWKLIIALGAHAMKWTTPVAKYIQPIVVQHPSSWKRFHSKEEYPLIPLLKDHLAL
jgi:hypothetical protein